MNVEDVAPPLLGRPVAPVQATPPVRPLQKPSAEARTLVTSIRPPTSRIYGRPPPASTAGALVARSQPMIVSGCCGVPLKARPPPQPTSSEKPGEDLLWYSAPRVGGPRSRRRSAAPKTLSARSAQ